jgi:tetratricopeptide (TPR) repeat protein
VVPREPTTPLAPSRAIAVLRSVRVYDALAEAAHQHVALGERDEALRTIADAVELLDGVRDRRPFARVLVEIGECLVELGCVDRARPLLEEAFAHAESLPDARLGARARRAMAAVASPAGAHAKEAVEDALREAMDEALAPSAPPASVRVRDT